MMTSPTSPSSDPNASPRPGSTAPSATVTVADVIVLGGGPAGIATALEVARRGLRVIVLERADTTGGMAGSFEIDGIRVDHGSHRLHPVTPPQVMARLTDLLGDDLQVRPRHGRLRLLNAWVDFPLRPAGLAAAMPKRWLGAVARDVALSPLRARRTKKQAASYAASLRSSLGPAVYDTLYAPYAEKLWGLPGEQIDAEQARVRVSADTVPKVARRVVRGQKGRLRATAQRHRRSAQDRPGAAGSDAVNAGSTFLYPRRGFGQIVESLDGAARAAGADIHTGTQVTAIKATETDAMVTVRTADGAHWRAPRVFSTLPIPLLARLSDPAPPGHIIEDAKTLRFRSMVLVYVTHRPRRASEPAPEDQRPPRPRDTVRWSTYDAHYLPGRGTPITRISEPANYRDSTDDARDRSVLCAEIPCAIGDEMWSASDEELSRVVAAAIATFDLPPLECTAVQTRRLRAVYPIYEHGFSERLARLEGWADSVPGVTTLGRSGLFAHDNTHHAFVMAQKAAQCMRQAGSFDDDAWHSARESFREHVVED